MLGIKSKKFIHAGTHSDFSTNCIRPAFTLAEVLITLGIIGAVAVGLIDGSSIAIAANGSNASGENRGNGKLEKTFAYIYVDVNNSNGPNVWGKIYLDFI